MLVPITHSHINKQMTVTINPPNTSDFVRFQRYADLFNTGGLDYLKEADECLFRLSELGVLTDEQVHNSFGDYLFYNGITRDQYNDLVLKGVI